MTAAGKSPRSGRWSRFTSGEPAGGIGAARDQVSTSLTGGAGARGVLRLVEDICRLDGTGVAAQAYRQPQDRAGGRAMLIIKAHQIEAFARPSMERYKKALIDYLHTAWPRECRLTGGDAALLHAVRRIVRAAQANGYETSRQLTLYANLVFSLGIGFDTDPQFHWASTALLNKSDRESDRADRAVVRGVDRVFRQGRRPGFRTSRTCAATGAGVRLHHCSRHYGRRSDRGSVQRPGKTMAGEAGVSGNQPDPGDDRSSHRKSRATRHHLPDGRCVFATASYFFGHGVDIDPLHPWMASVLTGARGCAGNGFSDGNGDRKGAGNGNGAGNDAGAGEARRRHCAERC